MTVQGDEIPRRKRQEKEALFRQINQEVERHHKEHEPWPHYYKIRYLDFLSYFEVCPKVECGRILELGCGIGYYSLFLSCLADEVQATDMEVEDHATHSQGLQVTRDFIEGVGVGNINVQHASAEMLPFPDGHFDMVFSSHVLEHVRDRQKAIEEMTRVLKPGGVGITILPTRMDRLYTLPWYYAYLLKRSVYHVSRRMIAMVRRPPEERAQITSSIREVAKGSSIIEDFPWPPTHGEFNGYLDELISWAPGRWKRLITDSGKQRLLLQCSTVLIPFPIIDIFSRNVAVVLHSSLRKLELFVGKLPMLRTLGVNTVLVSQKVCS
jgi:ubiquinone/menaquinone biosynthesis C-methylase UbiE